MVRLSSTNNRLRLLFYLQQKISYNGICVKSPKTLILDRLIWRGSERVKKNIGEGAPKIKFIFFAMPKRNGFFIYIWGHASQFFTIFGTSFEYFNFGRVPPPLQFMSCNVLLFQFQADLFPQIVFRLSHNALATFIFRWK